MSKNNKAEYTLYFEYDHDKLKSWWMRIQLNIIKDAQECFLGSSFGEFIITDDVTGMKG